MLDLSVLNSIQSIVCSHCGARAGACSVSLSSQKEMASPPSPDIAAEEDSTDTQSTPGICVPEENDFLQSLNPEQQAAAMYDGDAKGLLVLAGAGCGKTRTMVGRAIFLLEKKHIFPERLAMLTFTRRAAREILERIERNSKGNSRRIFVGTFHRFCLNLIHRHPQFFELNDSVILDREDQLALLKKIRHALTPGLSKEERDRKLLKEGELINLISYMTNCCLSLQEYAEKFPDIVPTVTPLLGQAIQEYRKHKTKHHYLDFDDILAIVANGLQSNPDFRKAVQRRFAHILVDEMQDTSPVQWAILKHLYRPVQLFCVGDDAQSIYAFRGADFHSVHHFCDVLPESKQLSLTCNYRSRQEILDLANVLLEASPLQYNKKLHAFRGASPAHRLPSLQICQDEYAEATYIADSICKHLQQGVPPSEIQVLLRTAFSGRQLEAELRQRHVPYRMIGGMSFLQAAHVKDVVSTMEAIQHPDHELAWMRTLTLFRGIGPAGAEKMFQQANAQGQSPEECRALLAAAISRKAPYAAEFLRGCHPCDDAAPADILAQIFRFFEENQILSARYDNWEERKRDLDALHRIAEHHRTIRAFLEAFKLDPDTEKQEVQEEIADKVTLITIHSAKGTEAQVCFIPRFQQGVFPHFFSSCDADAIEEERRILYVAITRAKDELLLSRCQDAYTSPFQDVPFSRNLRPLSPAASSTPSYRARRSFH